MTQEIILSPGAPKPIGPYSQAIKAGPFLFLSGQIPLDPVTGQMETGDIEKQTRRVLDNLTAVMQTAGGGLKNIIKTTLFIKNMEEFPLINKTYESYFQENPPARSTVEVSKLPRGAGIEIEAIAYLA